MDLRYNIWNGFCLWFIGTRETKKEAEKLVKIADKINK